MAQKKHLAAKTKRTKYNNENRAYHNKIKKLKKTLKNQPQNLVAQEALKRLQENKKHTK